MAIDGVADPKAHRFECPVAVARSPIFSDAFFFGIGEAELRRASEDGTGSVPHNRIGLRNIKTSVTAGAIMRERPRSETLAS